MSHNDVRDRCEALVAALPLQTPFTVGELARDLSRERSRPIHLHRQAAGGGPCGVLISTDAADYVFYDGSATALHRQHIILHELGHLLAGHDGPAPHDVWASRLIPNVDRSTVAKVLGRSSYAEIDEVEAELFASLAVERVSWLARSTVGQPAANSDDVIARLTAALTVVPVVQ